MKPERHKSHIGLVCNLLINGKLSCTMRVDGQLCNNRPGTPTTRKSMVTIRRHFVCPGVGKAEYSRWTMVGSLITQPVANSRIDDIQIGSMPISAAIRRGFRDRYPKERTTWKARPQKISDWCTLGSLENSSREPWASKRRQLTDGREAGLPVPLSYLDTTALLSSTH